MANPEDIHWFKRSPENITSISCSVIPAFTKRLFIQLSNILLSAFSKVFSSKKTSLICKSKKLAYGPCISFGPTILDVAKIQGLDSILNV